MTLPTLKPDLRSLVENLSFAQKEARSLALIERAYVRYGKGLVVAHSLGKDSSVVWHLAKRVDERIRGFIVTTRFKPEGTVRFMREEVRRHQELAVFQSDAAIPEGLHATDPDRCCQLLKVEPTRRALASLGADCWITGLRCTEGRTRTEFREREQRGDGLEKLNPILIWNEREVWQYLALYQVPVNPLYLEGYRSLGCEPCTQIAAGGNERDGRWLGLSKCGGECGIHTQPLGIQSSRDEVAP
ncbi:MAG: phosphoadenylyl-sulfate reductase [bacterium]